MQTDSQINHGVSGLTDSLKRKIHSQIENHFGLEAIYYFSYLKI